MTVPMQTAVERLIDARSSHRLVAPLSETYGDLSLADAYEIQDALDRTCRAPATGSRTRRHAFTQSPGPSLRRASVLN